MKGMILEYWFSVGNYFTNKTAKFTVKTIYRNNNINLHCFLIISYPHKISRGT